MFYALPRSRRGARRLLRRRRVTHAALALATLALAFFLVACDSVAPTGGPPTLDEAPLSDAQQALVVEAFEAVEALFDQGFNARPEHSASEVLPKLALAAVDTTTYTGVYDTANGKGYLAQLAYRRPQGVDVWELRLQHARPVDHDDDPGTPAVPAVETVTLSFIQHSDLAAFIEAVETGANAYLLGTDDDPAAAFAGADVWRVARVYAPGEDGAVVTMAAALLRETVAVREPIVTRAANGTGTVRDGGPDGAVRTRYYGADFAVAADGSVTGTLLRTLLSAGDTADGALVSRTVFPDGSWRETRQRGGDGVVIRDNSEG